MNPNKNSGFWAQWNLLVGGWISVPVGVMHVGRRHRSSVLRTLPDLILCLFIWLFLTHILYHKTIRIALPWILWITSANDWTWWNCGTPTFLASQSEVWVAWGPPELAAGIHSEEDLVEDGTLNLRGLHSFQEICQNWIAFPSVGVTQWRFSLSSFMLFTWVCHSNDFLPIILGYSC